MKSDNEPIQSRFFANRKYIHAKSGYEYEREFKNLLGKYARSVFIEIKGFVFRAARFRQDVSFYVLDLERTRNSA